jgi:23S rRNA pseudouridine1911/1915/1917 synthase
MLITVSAEGPFDRIDKFIALRTGITRSQVKHLIESSGVLVNGRGVKTNYRAKPGDRIELTIPEEEPEGLVPEDIPLDVLFMDDEIAVIDKPPSMVVYPAAGHKSGTIMNALAHRAKSLATIGGPIRPGIVHRLDKDTSGVMVVALTDRAYYSLSNQFKERTAGRSYIALVFGCLRHDRGEISLRIGRSTADRKKMSTRVRQGKEARTQWEVIERFDEHATLIKATLATGRTHQIRVHFASTGYPVLGDMTYGKKSSITVGRKKISFPRQMLHAETLTLEHPSTGKKMEFHAPAPPDMQETLKTLRDLQP